MTDVQVIDEVQTVQTEQTNAEISETETNQSKKKSRTKSPTEQPDSTSEYACEVSDTLSLGVFKLNELAVVPEFKTEESACFDLTAVVTAGDQLKIVTHSQNVSTRKATDKGVMIQQGERILVPTGLAFDIPKGYCLEIYPRSGISFSRGISLNNCTAIIDSDYVEEVFISVNNVSGGSQYIENGERIAQAKLVRLHETAIKVLDKKPGKKTSRSGGFGSTGTK